MGEKALELNKSMKCPRLAPHLHRDSNLDPDPDWLCLHKGILDSNPESGYFFFDVCGL